VETKKVVWPSRKDTVQTTGVVVAFMIVMALFLWIVDVSLAWIVDMFIGGA
jgi:preprotein translocase subunit SecE